MFRKISLKTKIIIFIVLSIIGIILITMTGIDNRKQIENTNINDTKTEIKPQEVKDTKDIKDDNKKSENNIQVPDVNIEKLYEDAYNNFHSKRYSESIKISDEVIKNDPNYYKAYNIKGIALSFSGNYDEGMKNIDKSLSINPDFGYGRFNKALSYELYGYYDDAIKWYNEALKVEKYIWSYYGLSSIYGRKGDVDNTVKYLKIAIDMDASVKNIAKEEKDFDNVKENEEFQNLLK